MSANAQFNKASIELTSNAMIDHLILHTNTSGGHTISVEWQEIVRVKGQGWDDTKRWFIQNSLELSPRQAQLLIDALIYGLDVMESMPEDEVERIDHKDLATPRPTINDVKRNAEESAGENYDALKGIIY